MKIGVLVSKIFQDASSVSNASREAPGPVVCRCAVSAGLHKDTVWSVLPCHCICATNWNPTNCSKFMFHDGRLITFQVGQKVKFSDLQRAYEWPAAKQHLSALSVPETHRLTGRAHRHTGHIAPAHITTTIIWIWNHL
jgi:hypothetical protein